MRVLLPAMAAERLAELRAATPGVELIPYESEADALAKAGDVEGFYGTPTPELLRAAPRLRWVQVGSAGVEHIGRADELHALLPQADHVAICCALTPATYHLFADREFGLMKPTAFIHNVTRGGVIDHDALVRALRAGAIAGAGLDVTEPEPLPPGHPLWQMPNVLVTPHASGHSPHSGRRMFDLLRENLRRFAAGEPLLNVVDKQAGV